MRRVAAANAGSPEFVALVSFVSSVADDSDT